MDGVIAAATDNDRLSASLDHDLCPLGLWSGTGEVGQTGDVVIEIPDWNRNYVSEGGVSSLGPGAIPPPKGPVPGATAAEP